MNLKMKLKLKKHFRMKIFYELTVYVPCGLIKIFIRLKYDYN